MRIKSRTITVSEETPLSTLIGRSNVVSTHPEWQIDVLATPAANKQLEGNDWTFSSITPTSRVGNYTQISDKRIVVSKTEEKVSKAGRKSELKRELKKKGTELKKDMEYAILSNQASLAGAAGTERQLGGFPAWLTSNDSRGGSGADGGFNTSTLVVDAATTGTQRAFTKTILDDVLQAAYTSGGDAKNIMLSPYCKRVFSGFSGITSLRTETGGKKQATIYAGADEYISDWGPTTVIPNRVMATDAATARRAMVIDPSMASIGILRDIELHTPAMTGDADKRVLNVEYTLIMNNQAAHGTAEDLYGLTAST